MMDCLFCKIINKEIPAEIIFEDDHGVGILDIHPIAPGHTMVLSKKHAETILDLSDEEVGNLFRSVKRITKMLKTALPDGSAPHRAEHGMGFTIGINHGRVAGQAIDHLHIHIIPRWDNDGGGSIHSVVNNPPTETIETIANKIR